jgi:hypothetical protein
MPKPAGVFARNGGRILLTFADLVTIAAPLYADWNTSHIFNERWPSHARFHGVVGLGTAIGLAGFGMARLWVRTRDQAAGRDFAAAVPLAYWGSFFPAALVKGTGVDDEPYPVGRILGLPANLFYALLTTALAIWGWLLDRRFR